MLNTKTYQSNQNLCCSKYAINEQKINQFHLQPLNDQCKTTKEVNIPLFLHLGVFINGFLPSFSLFTSIYAHKHYNTHAHTLAATRDRRLVTVILGTYPWCKRGEIKGYHLSAEASGTISFPALCTASTRKVHFLSISEHPPLVKPWTSPALALEIWITAIYGGILGSSAQIAPFSNSLGN